MSFTNYSADLLNNFLLNTETATRPTAWFAELHVGDPGDTGAANPVTAMQDALYGRKAVTFGASASKKSLNTNAPSWTVSPNSPGFNVTHVTIWDADNTITTLEDCEDLWDESVDADVTVSLSTDSKVGTNSNKFVVAATAVAGDVLATEAIASTNISTATTARFWIKSSVATAAGDLHLLLGETAIVTTANAAEILDVPALAANTWTYVSVPLVSAGTARDAIISVGLRYTVDIGACDIYIDDVKAVLLAGNCLRRGKLAVPEALVADGIFTLAAGKIIEAITVDSLA